MLDDFRHLVKQCLRGDQTAMSALVSQYKQRVFALCYRMLGHYQDAEDVTQQTFVRVLRHLAKWDQDRDFEPWLLAIAGNRCRTAISTRMRRPGSRLLDESIQDGEPNPHNHDMLSEEVNLALAKLRSDYREAFLLFHQQELSYQEIADRFERPIGTIKIWIHRARQQLIAELRQRDVISAASRQGATAN